MRAAIYARFSSDLQRDASIEDQIRSCQDYAARQGLNVVEVYTDRAVSGASLMRSGIQKLLRDAQRQKFDVVIAEALDRLSRNQADIAQLFQTFTFSDVLIETVSEGAISEMHIGLKGTMNALFLKDLAVKTHRGLKGRALAGKSAGGLTFGYRTVHAIGPHGDVLRGEREIHSDEAKVVRRIFRDYAKGLSPKKIAEQLNFEGIHGPQGGQWGASTIHGNRLRGTGILNNELYIGRQIWNRLRYVKDPRTGKRVSRLNPEHDWVVTDLPALRIITEDLWNAVRQRQKALVSRETGVPVWDRRRPRTLFSGMMECGCCGSGFSKVSRDSFGCSAARNKGKAVCSNMRMIKQSELEALVLDALAYHLMEPQAVAAFCEAYASERNRLAAAATQGRDELERELTKVRRDHDKLIDAIISGVPAEQVKDRMIALDARRQEIERVLAQNDKPVPVRFHPAMSATYRDRVASLIRSLGRADSAEEAYEAVRALVEKIVLTPDPNSQGLLVDLHGALAALLRLATGQPAHQLKGQPQTQKASELAFEAFDIAEELVLVAGVGFEPTTFRL